MLLVFSGMSALETPSARAGGNHTLRVGPQVPRQVQIARATGKPLKQEFPSLASRQEAATLPCGLRPGRSGAGRATASAERKVVRKFRHGKGRRLADAS